MCKYLTIYEEAVCHMALRPIPSEFPYIRGNFFFFFICVVCILYTSVVYIFKYKKYKLILV
jgi:hypothetical protein